MLDGLAPHAPVGTDDVDAAQEVLIDLLPTYMLASVRDAHAIEGDDAQAAKDFRIRYEARGLHPHRYPSNSGC